MPLEVSSPSNALLKRIRRIRRGRKDGDPAIVEGVGPVGTALEAGATFETVLFSPELLRGEGGRKILGRLQEGGLQMVRVGPEAFRSVSTRDDPAGLLSLVRPRVFSLDEFDLSSQEVAVVLHEPASPGNLGTIVRTMDAAGCPTLIVAGGGTDPWGDEAVKAGMGTIFSLRVAQSPTLEAVLRWAREGGIQVVATSVHADVPLPDAPIEPPCVLLFGSERHGLPPEARDGADLSISIPMRGRTGSLNLSVAAGIVLYELTRRRRAIL